MQDKPDLPKRRDSLRYFYVEHAILNQQSLAMEFINQAGYTVVPIANLYVSCSWHRVLP